MSDPGGEAEQPHRTPGGVDVVIPTNRLSGFLPEALRSVASQGYENWRVVLVDDGSDRPDELERLVARLPDAVVIHQEPAGVSAARNAAIRAGRGEFVTFLDDDDRWPPGRLAALVEALRRHPDAAGAFGDGRYIDAGGEAFGSWRTASATQEAFLRGATPIPRITALMVRRSALEHAGLFDESLRYSEDDELILRLLRSAPMVGVGEIVVDYRRHDDNATRADWRVRFRSASAAVGRNIEAAKAAGRPDHVRLLRRNLRRVRSSTAANSTGRIVAEVRAKDYRAAARDLVDSVRIAPAGFLRGFAGRIVARMGWRPPRQPGAPR